jgi:phosphate starvation-inducible protein PhoH and related proteins
MRTPFMSARPKAGQSDYWEALKENQIVFVSGLAGTGKTFLAINRGLSYIYDKGSSIEKICIIRPYIMSKTGEELGALPGTLDEKVAPFIASIKDNLEECLNDRQEVERIMKTKLECLTLSTLRGRSLNNRYIIVEEAQNVPVEGDGMLTILTRLGKNSRMVVAGDPSQCDLDPDDSGFIEAANALKDLEQVKFVEMEDVKCIHRHPLIGKIIEAFNNHRKFHG